MTFFNDSEYINAIVRSFDKEADELRKKIYWQERHLIKSQVRINLFLDYTQYTSFINNVCQFDILDIKLAYKISNWHT